MKKKKTKLDFGELKKELKGVNRSELTQIIASSGDLTPEQLWFIMNPLIGYDSINNSEYAISKGDKFENANNGYGDALRNSLFTVLNTIAFGKNDAITLGIAHELSNPIIENEYAMDIHNNQWRANYVQGKSSLNINQFISDFNQAVLQNKIIIMIDISNGTPSPSSGIQDFTYNGYRSNSGYSSGN